MHRTTLLLASCCFLLPACGGTADDQTAGAMSDSAAAMGDTGAGMQGPAATATAAMRDATGRDLGTLTLADAGQGITVSGSLSGLPPGEHALHIHMTGQCEAPFASAGGHWNPTNAQHGLENTEGPHFGDMPNFTVAEDSTASIQATTPGGTLSGDNALLDADGAAVVIHAAADDNHSDPAGNAGDRIACGVIQAG